MKPHLQHIKCQPSVRFDHQLPVNDELRSTNVAQQGYDFRKVSSEWLTGLGSEVNGIARLESHAPEEAIPLRLILPPLSVAGNHFRRPSLHRARIHSKGEG